MSHLARLRSSHAYARRPRWAVQAYYFDDSTGTPHEMPEPQARRTYRENVARARVNGGGWRLLRGRSGPGKSWVNWRTVKAAFRMAENE